MAKCGSSVALLGCLVAYAAPLHPQSRNTQDSGKSFHEAAPAPSSTHRQEMTRAGNLLETGSIDQAIKILREVVRVEPANGDAHLLLGSALTLAPERTEALKELQEAVELQPSSVLAHFTLGTAQARFGEPDAAKQSLGKALQLDPGFAEAHVSLAMILGQQHEGDIAREHLNKAIRIYGGTSAAAPSHYLLAQILTEQNQPDKALEELDTAISLRPNYGEAFVAQGFIRKWQHNDAAAIAAFKKATVLAPANFDAQYELGTAYLRADDAAQAIEPLRQAAQLKPNDRQTFYHLCLALKKAGEPEDAKTCQQQLSAIVSAGIVTAGNELASTQANNAGVELEKAGDLAGALEKYRDAVRLDPKVTVFRRNEALALCRLGRWHEAIPELQEVLKQDPDDAQATKAVYIALENARAGKSKGPTPVQAHPGPR